MLVLLTSLAALMTCTTAGSSKKGVAFSSYNYHCDDLNVLNNIVWWYDWNQTPYYHHKVGNCSGPMNQRHRVPMVWGWRHGVDYPLWFHNDTSRYVLGFNEPNHRGQSNLTPQEAAEAWKVVQARADRQKQLLVSPSAIKCTSGSSNCMMSGVQWFTEFFHACSGCRVDHVATHYYTCEVGRVLDYLEELHQRFQRPVWLTEVACPTHSYSQALIFMQELLPRLENTPYVYRYAWYASRVRGGGAATHEDSLMHTHSSTFTTLGSYYHNFM
ncbi:uncharacterized protein LOC143294033 [Babylonia areolata]|uniref:uncharacterized protein LOC143294033 n=1 Tax=Babylonia areolata TaxID=304850 RepID=UPI003FD37646